MATYFNGTHDIHPENIQKLYLMNPNFNNYSDMQPASHLIQLPYTQQAQHLVGIPIQAARSNQEVNIGMQGGLINSKYLIYAQQLLDEVVNIGKVTKDESMKKFDGKGRSIEDGDRYDKAEKGSIELTIMERQEIQMKKAKLVNMLDEVIQRYKHYHNQMQVVVSSFEAAAGVNSAKTYTALALQTISKQFRCLKDAITRQIRAAATSLGEEDSNEVGTDSKFSRLKFVDQQVRQQRALQQLGMIQHNAWRPQRGLPERSVSVLRAWLFEHFLHPYPKDTDKKMLAKQTGLTRSQVSNWFINARVRLWKPMVEEMYKEEIKDQEQNIDDEKTSDIDGNEGSSSKSSAHREISPQKLDDIYPQQLPIIDDDDSMFIQSKMKKARIDEEPTNRVSGNSVNVGDYVDYSIEGIERFGIEQYAPRLSGNNISLTLGLTNYDSLSLSGAQPTYLSNNSIPFETRVENGNENYGFSNLSNNSLESRKRFATQLLPDFVA